MNVFIFIQNRIMTWLRVSHGMTCPIIRPSFPSFLYGQVPLNCRIGFSPDFLLAGRTKEQTSEVLQGTKAHSVSRLIRNMSPALWLPRKCSSVFSPKSASGSVYYKSFPTNCQTFQPDFMLGQSVNFKGHTTCSPRN